MPQVLQVTSKEFILGSALQAGSLDTSFDIFIDETPNFTSGVVKMNIGENTEWASFSSVTFVSANRYTLGGVVRGLKKNASSPIDNDTTLIKKHDIGTFCELVWHSVDINTLGQVNANNTQSGDNSFSGTNVFQSTTEASFIYQNVTTAERDALVGVAIGAIVYNSDTQRAQVWNGSAWVDLPLGSTNPYATETTAGRGELATVADQIAGSSVGDSGAGLFLQAKNIITSSSGAGDVGKILLLDSFGVLPVSGIGANESKFGGDGSNGDFLSPIGISASGYTVYNYNNFIPGAGTVNLSGNQAILHLKIKGNCDLTDTYIDGKGNGGNGGAGGTSNHLNITTNGQPGVAGVRLGYPANPLSNTGGGGGTSGVAGSGGSGGVSRKYDINFIQPARMLVLACGSGGAGGGGGYNSSTSGGSPTTPNGGNGGHGGACIVLEVFGNVTFSNTTIDVRGDNGDIGLDGTFVEGHEAGGGGGGGGGGMVIILYNGTVSGSPTILTSGGTGAIGGSSGSSGFPGGGGGGGASILNNGTNGTTAGGNIGGTGGNGGNGVFTIQYNHVFT